MKTQMQHQPPVRNVVGLAWMVLIPVVLLTGFAVVRIWQERVHVLDQARQEASVLAPRLLALAAAELEKSLVEKSASGWMGEAEFHPPDDWIRPRSYSSPPLPPTWFQALAANDRSALQDAEQLESDPAQITRAQEAWNRLARSAPQEAIPYARYRALRLLASTPKRTALIQWLPDLSSEATTPRGLPLIPLVLVELLPTDDLNPPTSFAWTNAVERAIRETPSLIIPRLLERLETLVRSHSELQLPLSGWRDLWQHEETTRRRIPLWSRARTASPNQNWHWISDPDTSGRVLALLSDPSTSATTGHVFFLEEPELNGRFHRAVDELRGLLPAHFQARLLVADKAPLATGVSPTSHSRPVPLAVAEQPLKVATLGLEFPVRLELALGDPAALYRQQNRRAWTLGIAVVVAGGMALLGVSVLGQTLRRQRALYEAQSNFISSVSHELRTPIAAMSLMAENLARDDSLEVSRKKDYYRLLVQECRRLSTLLENVLSLARIEQQREPSALEPFNFTSLVQAVTQSMQPLAEARGVRLVASINETDEVEAIGDPTALERALVNLIDNAIKHSPDRATVSITLESDPTGVGVSVQDQGPGIPREEQKKVFERFYRRGSELRRETKGIGIGLTLVQQIAQAHGGSIELRSGSGHGCRFTLRIPHPKHPPL